MKTFKQFEQKLVSISKNANKLQQDIHDCAMFALEHLNRHNNMEPTIKLIAALPKGQRVETLKAWFVKFGKVQLNEGKLDYKNKAIEDQQAMLDNADLKPYWELIKEQQAERQIKALELDDLIFNAARAVFKAEAEGREVKNEEKLVALWSMLPESKREKLLA